MYILASKFFKQYYSWSFCQCFTQSRLVSIRPTLWSEYLSKNVIIEDSPTLVFQLLKHVKGGHNKISRYRSKQDTRSPVRSLFYNMQTPECHQSVVSHSFITQTSFYYVTLKNNHNMQYLYERNLSFIEQIQLLHNLIEMGPKRKKRGLSSKNFWFFLVSDLFPFDKLLQHRLNLAIISDREASIIA